jgi:hypothetical protein
MTQIDITLDPFVEAEIKEHHAALIRGWDYHLCYVGIGGAASVSVIRSLQRVGIARG